MNLEHMILHANKLWHPARPKHLQLADLWFEDKQVDAFQRQAIFMVLLELSSNESVGFR